LLLNSDFCARLPEVNLFVASHHGRENGKCDELFRWFRPDLVVFSDGPKEHETQETTNWYRWRATGIPDYSLPSGLFGQPRRYVMTTRSDGTIHVDIAENGRWNVTTSTRTNPLLAALGPFGLSSPPNPWSLLGG